MKKIDLMVVFLPRQKQKSQLFCLLLKNNKLHPRGVKFDMDGQESSRVLLMDLSKNTKVARYGLGWEGSYSEIPQYKFSQADYWI